MKILSAANPRIKQIVKLRERRVRRETGLTVVEGVKEILVAQQSGLSFKEYYVCPELLTRHAKGDFL